MKLDIVLGYESDILFGVLDDLQAFLLMTAPKWSSRLRAFLSGRPDTVVDLTRPDGLAQVAATIGTMRGPVFRSLVDLRDADRFGDVEFRGASSSMVLPVSFDVRPYRHAGETRYRGNSIALQIRASKVDGVEAASWADHAIREMCRSTSPAFARAGMVEEFNASNLVSDSRGTWAIGVDIGGSISGLYWRTFFGRPYVELLGRESLETAPAPQVETLDAGVLIGLSDRPDRWDTPVYRTTRDLVEAHLGRRYFWDRTEPDRETTGLRLAD